jgi:hypothetical protein
MRSSLNIAESAMLIRSYNGLAFDSNPAGLLLDWLTNLLSALLPASSLHRNRFVGKFALGIFQGLFDVLHSGGGFGNVHGKSSAPGVLPLLVVGPGPVRNSLLFFGDDDRRVGGSVVGISTDHFVVENIDGRPGKQRVVLPDYPKPSRG